MRILSRSFLPYHGRSEGWALGPPAHTEPHAASMHVCLQETYRVGGSKLNTNTHDTHVVVMSETPYPTETRKGTEKENNINQAEQAPESHTNAAGKERRKRWGAA